MTSAAGPEKIAILGGGIGALATAFELTSQPGWRERFDITIHTLGWRLGGKCASSRGPDGRIEEHGIHGFLGSYCNAMPMMAACYAELGRPPGAPLATFEEAFLPENFALMWEFRDGALRKWTETFPTNDLEPSDGTAFVKIEDVLARVFEFLDRWTQNHGTQTHAEQALAAQARGLVAKAATAVAGSGPAGSGHPLIALLEDGWRLLGRLILDLVEGSDALRRLFIFVDYIFTLVLGFLRDDIVNRGFDSIDDENWSDWLLKHGANPITVSSPLAMTTINLSYQYPTGDTTVSPRMAAGAYLHWTLKAFAYMGSSAWMFAAGTGETIIAPLYLVLRARGVKFAFFHKVEALRLTADASAVQSVEIAVQAHLKDPAKPYEPLFDVKGLPSWPRRPFHDQLVEGEALEAGDIDLESWWTPWIAPGHLALEAGADFDRLVFAISIGAIPYLCGDLITARPAWGEMVTAIPTVRTQTLQVWLSKDMWELGWDIRFTGYDTLISCTYLTPGNGQVEFRHLIPLEDWPADRTPKSLWYFCGLMSSYGADPPFTDHGFPNRQWNRVRFQSIQYLQAGMGPLLPKATTDARNPPGDPVGFDFNLLVDTLGKIEPDGVANAGIARIESQYWRANIDPTERYVTSPPGSTKHRLKAWDSGFSNLVVAGDWIYTGLNVGSVEGTVMSGKLASYALSGAPARDTIIGYPKAKT
jgi:uncharacterized protein with NAD-binding domain and iron-sulfur cluster